jgi:hypothetical protein
MIGIIGGRRHFEAVRMIRYRLRCTSGHEFEAWFRSSSAFDEQAGQGLLSCADCGISKVEKALMAPSVAKPAAAETALAAPQQQAKRSFGTQLPAPMLEMMRKIRDHVRENSENVGDRFAEEARRIHYEESEPRGIYGETTISEARDLHDEGIEVHPLPELPEDAN